MYQLTVCAYCKKEILKRHYDIRDYKNNFCDKDCHALFKVTSIILPCANCGLDVTRTKSQLARSKSGDVFCNRTCATITNNSRHKKWINHPQYKNGIRSYRAKAIEYYGANCQADNCPLNIDVPTKMLDVHHKDSDRSNNQLDNLEVLCVWCHALETRKNW